MEWLDIHRGDAPVLISMPHTGTDIPDDLEARFVSPQLARKDTDWWVEPLYDFAPDLNISTIRTRIARAVIDVNRDPDGISLYPGQVTTELCPTTSFDGEALYRHGHEPDAQEIAARRAQFFLPYHAALRAELIRLQERHRKVILFEAHSIEPRIPRLFDGELPVFNIGTNGGVSCDPGIASAVAAICAASGFSHVVNGRFKGGWTTRHYGRPQEGVHALQLELACHGTCHPVLAARVKPVLIKILETIL